MLADFGAYADRECPKKKPLNILRELHHLTYTVFLSFRLTLMRLKRRLILIMIFHSPFVLLCVHLFIPYIICCTFNISASTQLSLRPQSIRPTAVMRRRMHRTAEKKGFNNISRCGFYGFLPKENRINERFLVEEALSCTMHINMGVLRGARCQ